MSMFNKFAVMIAFAVCTTNAWAGNVCMREEIEKLNNDKYLYFEADTAGSPMMGFVCGGLCADGSKIIISDIQAYIAGNWLGTSGGTAGYQGFWVASRCSDRKIDSKWKNLGDLDLRNDFKECTDAQRSEYKALTKEGQIAKGDPVRIYCKTVIEGPVGGTYCVSSDPNNETICWVDKVEDDQKQVVAVPLTPSEEKTSETKKDCGNVGQRECDGRYWVCNSNADCVAGRLPSRATAGHCVVSAGRNGYKVCTATKCEDDYELVRDKNGNSQGWCQKKTEQVDVNVVSTDGAGQDEQGQTVNGDVADGTIVPGNPDQGQDKNVKLAGGDEYQKSSFDFSELDKILDKHFVGASVWKNSESNFNTARLASDSIAAVVSGTSGGVITSKIVKKNQIKSGFESLKCTIAGQDVATYGDDFTVGVN